MNDRIDGTAGLQAFRSHRGVVLGLAICALTLASCKPKLQRPAAETYPVSGEVKVLGLPLPAYAMIEFRPEAADKASDYTAKGLIDKSGKFVLRTPFIDRVLEGAAEGSHTVRIAFPSGDKNYPSGLIEISEKFVVEPHENHFTVTVPAKK